MEKRPHKFIVTAQEHTYARLVVCEYCGLVAFDGNRHDRTLVGQEAAKNGCPLSPEDKEVPRG
ncbi:MAG: hypothetical protein WC551_10765 [Patescibacteria group bacterium]